MKAIVALALSVCVILLAGCVSVPTTPKALDANAKQFAAEPDKAKIYVNRPWAFTGFGLLTYVTLDGQIVGILGPKTFQVLSVPPGEHHLGMTSTFAGSGNDSSITNTMEAGRTYFYKISAAWLNIKPVTEETGRKQVTRSLRAETPALLTRTNGVIVSHIRLSPGHSTDGFSGLHLIKVANDGSTTLECLGTGKQFEIKPGKTGGYQQPFPARLVLVASSADTQEVEVDLEILPPHSAGGAGDLGTFLILF